MAQAVIGNKVKVHYTGTLVDGEVFDSSRDRGPLEFTIGEGQLIPLFEDTVVGMKLGESRKVTIPPEKAYGLHRKEMVMAVERKKVSSFIKLEVGKRIEIGLDNGSRVRAEIIAFNEKGITVDANHPMAGKTLNFEIQLVEIL